MRYLEHLAIQQAYDIKERELVPPFTVMVALAFSMHILFLLVWGMLPERYLIQVPLQSLNVQLGNGKAGASVTPASAAKEKQIPAPAVATPAPQVQKKPAVPRRKPVGPQGKVTVRTPAVRKAAAPAAAILGGGMNPSAGAGVGMAGQGTGKQVVERYTRQLSLQVQLHAARIHMPEEIKKRAAGRPMVVELLLVISQNGSLSQCSVTRSSGFAELDSAAMQAARNAVPYPPPPSEYSGFGFKVAVFVD